MANLPQLITREQLIGLILDSMLSRIDGVNDLNPGSTLTQLAESVGQVIYKPYADVISMVDALSVDRAIGEALQRLAIDKNVPIFPALPSSGNVNITDLTFNKLQTTVYSGQPAPVAGSLVIYVSDASQFLPAGSIYVGRGTDNVEGPLTYTSITPQAGGTYYAINLNATSPTAKFHNIGESVVMAQGGNRNIPAGTLVQTPQGQLSTSATFITTLPSTILDGEITAENIPVVCQQVGVIGNVAKNAIQTVLGLTFSASASNPLPFTNGIEEDTDEKVRQRIKDYEQLKAKGTSDAIKASSLNITSPDELKRTTSSNIVNYSDTSAALVFDDGTGYEPLFKGIGLETVVDEALGGEKNLQLRSIPIAQARLKSGSEYPYNIPDLYNLSVSINGVSTVHQFRSTDFRVVTAATAQEVAASINSNSNINFSATTSDGGKNVVIFPKDPTLNNIKVNALSSSNANDLLKFSEESQEFTLRLYKNDELLYQDGLPAQVYTKSKPFWSTGIITGDTLIYNVDNTQDITVTFTNIDFQRVNPTSSVNFIEDIEIWVKVFNNLMPGVTASIDGDKIKFSSNKGSSDLARIEIVGGTLRSKIFDTASALISEGQSSDYTLNRNTSQVGLVQALEAGDAITAGSKFTRAKLFTGNIPNGATSSGNLWFLLDGGAEIIASGIRGTTQIQFTQSGSLMTLNGNNITNPLVAEGFEDVQPGDWILIWTNGSDTLQNNAGFWRVETAKTGQITYKDLLGTSSGLITNPPINKILFVRSEAPIQKVSYSGPCSLASLQSQIQSQLMGANVDVVGGKLRISTQTLDESGQILCIAADENAAGLLISDNKIVSNTTSHTGFNVTNDLNYGIPSFTYDTLSSVNSVTSQVQSALNYLDLNGDKEDYIELLDLFNLSDKSEVPDSNKRRRLFVRNFNSLTNTLTCSIPDYMANGESVPNVGDRFFLRKSYQLDTNDTLNVTIDQNEETKYYSLPVSRKLVVNNNIAPTTTSFSADDAQSDLALNDVNSFNGFNFADFKLWRRAYSNIQDALTGLSIKVSSADFGPSGNQNRFGFLYPASSSDTELSYKVDVSDSIDVGIVLPVKTVRTSSWNGDSAFTVSVLPGVNGEEYVTYQYKVGTQPNFVTTSALAIDDIAMISGSSDFLTANENFTAQITSFTADSFTVKRPIGSASNDAIVFDSIDIDGTASPGFSSGKITLTYSATHNISTGDIYDTAASATNPAIKPANSTYFATVSGSTITVPINTSIPGGLITSATKTGTVLKVYTNITGLSSGDLIKFRNIGASFSNKIYQVFNVGVGFFECTIDNSAGTFAIGATSRYDFQSITPDVLSSASISSVSRSGTSTVTVTLSVPCPFANGDTVQISGLDISNWSSATTYNVGDVIEYNSLLYKSLQSSNLNKQPDVNPLHWVLTDENLQGVFIIKNVVGSTFQYEYRSSAGSTSATSGSAVKMKSSAKLARCIGGSASYLEIMSVGATAQEVIDFAANEMADVILISNNSGGNMSANIKLSTQNSFAYLTGNITNYRTIQSSRKVTFTTSATVPKGSTITISGISADYNKTYTVLESVASGGGSLITCQSDKIASATASNAVAGTYLGSRPYVMFSDGDNSVSSSSLSSNPQFTLKESWNSAPQIGEELALVASNKEQLNEFWNKLIVSGIKNVASVENSKYGEEIQIATQTLGSLGSVEVVGGTANAGVVALVGSGKAQNNKLGLINIPYQLRKGMYSSQWISLSQLVQEKKSNGFSDSTVLNITVATEASAVSIASGSGSFVTKRPTTANNTTTFKIERHGNFTAFIRINGTSPSLYTAGVVEGDWVAIADKLPQTWSASKSYVVGNKTKYGVSQTRYVCIQNSTNNIPSSSPAYWKSYSDYSVNLSYSIGDYVLYGGRLWQALAGSTPAAPVTPGTDATVWQRFEFDVGNTGIFRVVRIYGQDAFWVEGVLTEEVTQLLDPADLSFYSYDSIMPGDVLVVSGDVLGQSNIGQYTVLDDSVDGSSFFPESTLLYTEPLTAAVVGASLTNKSDQFYFLEQTPVKLFKKIVSIGPEDGDLANILVDSPELISKLSSSNGAYLTMLNKLNYSTNIKYGIDGYQHYEGLMQEVNKVVYGDPTLPIQYPGVKAAGANVDIKPALIKKITMSVSVRIKTDLTYTEIQDSVKAAISGYIASLGVGESVSLSGVIATATNLEGIISVVITDPTFALGSDLIKVNPDEKALVINPATDITVTITGT
ncbi:hypothetical protein EBU95_04055 [bacterium]|nr:hypothetical protein [bacterium]